MSVPEDFFYSKSHEWVSINNGIATVGITDFAQSQLSDLTFVELPSLGNQVSSGDEVAVVESVKAAADVYSPIDGEIIEINNILEDEPEIINPLIFISFIIKVNPTQEPILWAMRYWFKSG